MPSPCKEICKSFTRKKLPHRGMYLSGQIKCKPCNVWMDHTSCHLFGGTPAIPGTSGWYCNYCRKVRMRPRTRVCKEMIRERMERAGKRTAYYSNEQKSLNSNNPNHKTY